MQGLNVTFDLFFRLDNEWCDNNMGCDINMAHDDVILKPIMTSYNESYDGV